MTLLTMIKLISLDNPIIPLGLVSFYFLRHEYISAILMPASIICVLIEVFLVLFSINRWLKILLKWHLYKNQVLKVPI